MASVVKGFQLVFAVVRIKCFQAYKAVFRGPDPPPRPQFDLIAAGLSGTGKTTVLSSLCGEENSNPEPTNGFAIKAAQLDQVIFNVKELGGSDKFRPYWDKYYNAEVDGLVFTLDATADLSAIDSSLTVLTEVEANPALDGVPLLILGTKRDEPNARSLDEIETLVKGAIPDVERRRLIRIFLVNAKDVTEVKAAFNAFSSCYDTGHDDA
eukprot:m.45060 g.45060  ORF g.45060 m.45060 type:complete len:210 (-) comp8598_c0_seq1:95-724(-)